jgi:hypothetical protein
VSIHSSAGTESAAREEFTMAQFILAYRSPAGYAAGGPGTVAAWRAWFAEMGPALQDVGRPVFKRATVGSTGGGSTHLGGYSLVIAADLDEAIALAKRSPAVAIGGGVDVGELADIPGEASAGQGAS